MPTKNDELFDYGGTQAYQIEIFRDYVNYGY